MYVCMYVRAKVALTYEPRQGKKVVLTAFI